MLLIKDIMTREVYTLNTTQSLDLVRSLMKIKHIRHIPIVNADHQFVGLLTHRDLLAHTVSRLADLDYEEQNALDQNIPLGEVMTTDIITVSPNLDLPTALDLMLEHKIGCLPVVTEDDKLVGIVTEADFLLLSKKLLNSETIASFANAGSPP